jgi:deoxyadenosine/deoxycytidine kinase
MLNSPPVNSLIEVCGGIASGKTTFAKIFQRIGCKTIFENFRTNPFWEAFYSDPISYAFETEITFTLQHYHQIKKAQSNNKINVCDFSFLLDLAYADIGLKGSRLDTFIKVYEEIRKELPPPALIIYLKCDAGTELDRIQRRGRVEEKLINFEFLASLNDALEKRVREVKDDLKIISIDSAAKNFVDNENTIQEILKRITETLQ